MSEHIGSHAADEPSSDELFSGANNDGFDFQSDAFPDEPQFQSEPQDNAHQNHVLEEPEAATEKPKRNKKQLMILGGGVVLIVVIAALAMTPKKHAVQDENAIASSSSNDFAPTPPTQAALIQQANSQSNSSPVSLTANQLQASANMAAAMGVATSSLPQASGLPQEQVMSASSPQITQAPQDSGQSQFVVPPKVLPAQGQDLSGLTERVTKIEGGLDGINAKLDAMAGQPHKAKLAKVVVAKKNHHGKKVNKKVVLSNNATMPEIISPMTTPSVMFLPPIAEEKPAYQAPTFYVKMYAKGISDDLCWIEADNKLSVYHVGDALPDGSKLESINAVSLKITTSHGVLEWK